MERLQGLWELLFPAKCVLCGRILSRGEQDLCRDCRVHGGESPTCKAKLPFLNSWLALWYYEGYVRRGLLRYKFFGKRHYGPSYGRLLSMKLLETARDRFDLITWVPISPRRKRRRGYDQVELLSRYVGQELGMEPVCCLKKIRDNPPQSTLGDAASRRANVLGVYVPVEPERFRGKRVLILDDVLTTGATAGECARVLLTEGAKEVHCAAIAAARHRGAGRHPNENKSR